MGTCPHIWFLLTLAIASGGVSTASLECSHECTPQSSVFKYQKGHTYTYNFEGTTVTSLSGTQGDPVRLKLRASADLSVVDECNRVLKLRGVTVTGPDSKNYGNLKDLEAHSVLANFKGNYINKNLCSEEGENQNALNIKRAILSLLQIPSTKSSTTSELDVFGICPTNVRYSNRGDTTVVSKTRDLNRCAYRENLKQEFLSTRFAGQSDVHSTPLLDADFHVEQQIVNGVIKSAVSRESYLFRPFSNQGNGAKTVVETKLTLASESAKAPPSPAKFNTPQSIVFEAPHVLDGLPGGSGAITAALHAAESSTKDGVSADAAAKFQTLVSVLRQSSPSDILKVYNDVKAGAGFNNKHVARKLLLDGLFRTSTGESVEVITSLLKSKEISTNHWYRNLAFIKHASLSSIVSISSILEQKNPPVEAFLGVGSFIGRYCREHNCENVAEFDQVLSKFSKHLDVSVATKSGENQVIAALKALQNIHHLNNAIGEKVKQLASDKSLKPRIRVAALEAIRSDPCRKNIKQAALRILADHLEDSELRIKAYLAVIECPCDAVVRAVSDILENEPIIQVGSFVVSHLRNLQASTDPAKVGIKQKLAQLKPKKVFSSDVRKYSQNYELSYAVDSINAGASLESNVIYSQSSFVPRSVSLNVSADIFGHSYNVFEIAARTENLDHIFEHYLGPKGYILSTDDDVFAEEVYNKSTSFFERISKRYERTFRQKRSVSQDAVDNIFEKAHKTLLPSQRDRSLDIDLSLKTFGSELAWFSYDGKHEETAESVVDKVFDSINKGLQNSKKFNHDFEPHFIFLDSELSYPTNLGFPLKLVIAGSIAARLKFNGETDILSALHHPTEADFRLEFVPSVAVDLVGKFLVDAYAVESGLKLDYNFHTSTGINVAVKNLNGLGTDIKVGLPVQKQRIINLQTEVLTTVKERGHPETVVPVHFNLQRKDFKEYHGCFDQLSPVSGLTFCGNVSVPWVPLTQDVAFFPLNGPSYLSVSIEADDVSQYHFRSELKKEGTSFKSVEVLFDTPGSNTDRKVLLVVDRKTKPHQQITATLKSAWKEIIAEGILIDDEFEKALSARLVIDSEEYSLKGGAKISGNPNQQVYKPILEYKSPSKKTVTKGRRPQHGVEGYSVDGTIVAIRSPGKNNYKFEGVSLKTPKGVYEVNGNFDCAPRNYALNLKLNLDKNELTVVGHLNYANERKLDVGIEIVSPQYPDYGYSFQLTNEKGEDFVDNKIAFAFGRDLRDSRSKITIENFVKVRYESLDFFDIQYNGKSEFPGHEAVAKFSTSSKAKHFAYNLQLGYDNHHLSSALDLKRDVKATDDYDLKFSAKVLDNSVKLESSREVNPKDDSVFFNTQVVLTGKKYQLQSNFKSASEDEYHTNIESESTLRIEGKPTIKLNVGLSADPQSINSEVKLTSGGEGYLDASYKINRASGNPSGNAKLFVKNYLDATATFKYNNGIGSGTLHVDVPKLHKKIKATGDLTLSGSQRSAAIDFYWDADRDQSRKLQFKTENEVNEKSVDSKNVLTILDSTTKLNFKGSLTGAIDDGELSGEGELILPCGRSFGVIFQRALHIKQSETTCGTNIQVQQRENPSDGQAQWKVNFLTENVFNQQAFEGDAKFSFETKEKQDVTLLFAGKSLREGDKTLISGQFSGQGSLIGGSTSVIKLNAEADKAFVTYNLNGEHSQGYRANVVGKVNRGHSPLIVKQIENTVELLLPFDKLKHFKHTIIGTFSSQHESAPEFTISNVVIWNNENTLKLIGEAAGDEKEGRTKWDLILPKEEPRTLETTWRNSGDNRKAGSLSFKWGGNKEAKVSTDVELTLDGQPRVLNLKASSPIEKFGNVDVDLSLQKLASPADKIDFDLTVVADQKKTDVKGSLGLAPGVPVIDVVVVQPSGTSKAYIDFLKKSESELHAAVDLQWVAFGGGSFIADGDIKLDVDDFYLKLNVDSPKFNFNKWHLEAGQRALKGSKRLIFTAKSAEKVVFQGSTSFRSKTDNNKISYDGNGQIRIGEKSHAFNFHSSRHNLLEETDKEVGVEYILTFDIQGSGSLENKLKLSNKEIHAFGKQCSQGTNKCAVVELQSKVKGEADAKESAHEFLFVVDLKSAGVDTGIHLTSETVRKGVWFIDQQASLTLSHNGDTTYKYKAYTKETGSGLTLTFPSRVIAAEIKVVPHVAPKHWKQQISASVWLDKTRLPNSYSSLLLQLEEIEDKDTVKSSGQLKFSHPNLDKDLSVKGYILLGTEDKIFDSNLEIDVFKQRNQKIVISSNIVKEKQSDGLKFIGSLDAKSKGHELDFSGKSEGIFISNRIVLDSLLKYKKDKQTKESEFSFEASNSKILLHAKIPNHHLLHIQLVTKKQNKRTVVDASVHIIGVPPAVVHFDGDYKGLPVLKGTVNFEGTPNKKLELIADVSDGLHLEADYLSESGKKELFYAFASSKKDSKKPELRWSVENVQLALEPHKNDVQDVLNKVKDISDEASEEITKEATRLTESLKSGLPNFGRFVSTYENQLKALKEEIANDKVLKEISENWKDIIGDITGVITSIINGILVTVDALLKALNEILETILETVKNLLPTLKDTFNEILKDVTRLLQVIVKEVVGVLSTVAEVLKKYEADFKEYLSIVTDLLGDLNNFLSTSINVIHEGVEDFVKEVVDFISNLPVIAGIEYAKIYEALQNIVVPQELWAFAQDVIGSLKDSAPTTELEEFLSALEKYIEKVSKKQDADVQKELKLIFEKAVDAIESLFNILISEFTAEEAPEDLYDFKIPTSLPTFFQLPRVISIRFSPLIYVFTNGVPVLTELITSYRPSLKFDELIPPYDATAILLNSHHIFTFDKRHVTFKGICSYILAQDIENKNFTIIANLEGGSLRSIIFSDKGNTVELAADRSLLVNGRPAEYPADEGDFHAWREYNRVVIESQAGVKVICELGIDICVFEVNGFYFGKTRGLLGTINNEPWDDFIKPDGQVATGANEFGNAWKVNTQCANVEGVDHHEHNIKIEECDEIFSKTSLVSPCSLFLDQTPYLEACNHIAHEANSKEARKLAACRTAAAYVKACHAENVFISVPPECVQCTIEGDAAVDVGQSFSVKTPQKSADVLIVLEQVTGNAETVKEFVSPIANQLTSELNSRGISDVRVSLLGYGAPDQEHPNVYTSSGGKLVYDGKQKNIKFGERTSLDKYPVEDIFDALLWLDEFSEQALHFITTAQTILEYPFRPGAAKAIIYVLDTPCETTTLLKHVPVKALKLKDSVGSPGIVVHLVTNVDAAQSKHLVGFDADHAYYNPEGKKRQISEASGDAKRALKIQETACTEIALATSGSVFNKNNLKQAKKFIAQHISDSLTNVELLEDCRCLPIEGLHTRTVCAVTGAREKEHLAVKGVKGTKGVKG